MVTKSRRMQVFLNDDEHSQKNRALLGFLVQIGFGVRRRQQTNEIIIAQVAQQKVAGRI
jgi:hypothetical protein